eukprot:CAMPEP_0179154702 /NCGR_PEP_ID=MMETSP0796-20121207/75309_1 /TAXON_ID=73915 /ORGANISM="Pyrodinium bahamense, Strain pbaha01" /LENGTH=256 /DNA_ID=CAMNT_0020856107 /DNA_START=77 /DNA_END=844 /DNA_ORIENTATION=+
MEFCSSLFPTAMLVISGALVSPAWGHVAQVALDGTVSLGLSDVAVPKRGAVLSQVHTSGHVLQPEVAGVLASGALEEVAGSATPSARLASAGLREAAGVHVLGGVARQGDLPGGQHLAAVAVASANNAARAENRAPNPHGMGLAPDAALVARSSHAEEQDHRAHALLATKVTNKATSGITDVVLIALIIMVVLFFLWGGSWTLLSSDPIGAARAVFREGEERFKDGIQPEDFQRERSPPRDRGLPSGGTRRSGAVP